MCVLWLVDPRTAVRESHGVVATVPLIRAAECRIAESPNAHAQTHWFARLTQHARCSPTLGTCYGLRHGGSMVYSTVQCSKFKSMDSLRPTLRRACNGRAGVVWHFAVQYAGDRSAVPAVTQVHAVLAPPAPHAMRIAGPCAAHPRLQRSQCLSPCGRGTVAPVAEQHPTDTI